MRNLSIFLFILLSVTYADAQTGPRVTWFMGSHYATGQNTSMMAQAPQTSMKSSSAGVDIEHGKKLYQQYCAVCHGTEGNGKGPVSASLPTPPSDFRSNAFWKGDTTKTIENAVENGYKTMPRLSMTSEQIRAVAAYIAEAFKTK